MTPIIHEFWGLKDRALYEEWSAGPPPTFMLECPAIALAKPMNTCLRHGGIMIDLDDFDLNFPDSEVDVDDICALVTSTQRSKLSFNKMGPKTLHSPFILDT